MTETAEPFEEGMVVTLGQGNGPYIDHWMVIGPFWDDGSDTAGQDAFDILIEGKAEAMAYAEDAAKRWPGCKIKVYESPDTSAAQSALRPAADPANSDEDDPAHHTGMLVTATVSLEPGSEEWLIVGPYWGPDGNDAMAEAPAVFVDGDEKAMAYAKELASNVEGGCRLNVYGKPAPKPADI
jgi:hypothetical protein